MTTIETHIAHAEDRPQALAFDLVKAAYNAFSAVMIAVLDWQYRARERRQLLALSDRALQDFGTSRAGAECEASKAFWQR